MRHTPHYVLDDVEEVRRLVRDNPWATFVSATSQGLVASHYPILLDEQADELTVLSHVGRPDDELLELGSHEMLIVVQGPHGYVSPSWYGDASLIPTWNHVTAHLYGVPEILDAEENYATLSRLVDTFEQHVAHPRSLSTDPAFARGAARGTVGLRMRVTRFDARLKLSQNKAPEVRGRIQDALHDDGPYANPALAAEMARVPALPRDAEGAE
ncbi:FMN-binding negative transcriptional regulator [Isoptericola chiayiensis]|uniref:FMN-binding negative transcriptional regulator n=1 Tax=Isoptericola chiayiensis TaxID=579446 RepID=A0ABP8XYL8_9MICO|nr:FMN-binding negative transcriptional regulator [Isoptericola chiayiensis]NOW01271.1 transcriptional regulator [Isoptericola chiayiensis]